MRCGCAGCGVYWQGQHLTWIVQYGGRWGGGGGGGGGGRGRDSGEMWLCRLRCVLAGPASDVDCSGWERREGEVGAWAG